MSCLRYLCLFVHSDVQHILRFVFVLVFFVLLPVSLDFPFLIAPSVFSNVFFTSTEYIKIFHTILIASIPPGIVLEKTQIQLGHHVVTFKVEIIIDLTITEQLFQRNTRITVSQKPTNSCFTETHEQMFHKNPRITVSQKPTNSCFTETYEQLFHRNPRIAV